MRKPKVGDFYYTYNGYPWVIKITKIVRNTLFGPSLCLDELYSAYPDDSEWGEYKPSGIDRLATFDEKQHLLQCIAAGKYVEYSKKDCLQLNYLIL